MSLEQYFKQHPTQKWYFKHGVVLLASVFVTLGLQAYSAGMFKGEYGMMIMTVLTMANEKLKIIDADAYWAGVGANAPITPPVPAPPKASSGGKL